jgi:coproporphyrinogen III oxidase
MGNRVLLNLICLLLLSNGAICWSLSSTHLKAASSTASLKQWPRPFSIQQKTSNVDSVSLLSNSERFDAFVDFLLDRQTTIIHQIEDLEASCHSTSKFSNDPWGSFAPADTDRAKSSMSGGVTRVIQGGKVVEKGACSVSLIKQGILSEERANSILARQSTGVRAGDAYSAAALSIVLHTRSPLIPTFRSDVRIFMVQPASAPSGDNGVIAWLGGGADLTPYYLCKDDIRGFHARYRDLCRMHFLAIGSASQADARSYESMKKACDDYFYLPARREHRGTGGIFFDDLIMTPEVLAFAVGVVDAWMPSWIPIVERYKHSKFSEQEKQWQMLRRGRYLEFNLLYDRGVRFGLASANPRVEGVMVSAPPVIAFEYNHQLEAGSREAELMDVLKNPVDWA